MNQRHAVVRALCSLTLAGLTACQPSAAPAGPPTPVEVSSLTPTTAHPPATPTPPPAVVPAAPSPSPRPSAPGRALARPGGTAPSEWPPVTELPSGDRTELGSVALRAVRVDQVGYLPGYRKLGLVAGANGTSFTVVDPATGTSVYAAELGEPILDGEAAETVRVADFSRLTRPGTYTLVVPGVGRSPDFRIGEDVYDRLFAEALSSYDLLADLAPNSWKTAKATERTTGREMDVAGGWPDAGDYGRYMPTATSTLGTLLMLAELFPAQTEAAPTAVDAQPGLPPYLRVLKREVDWMLKMQRADGAVYDKVTPLNFGGFDRGSDNVGGQLFVFDVSTPDTAAFAAVMAQAYRVYLLSDPAYALRLLEASERAWGWLEQHPHEILPTTQGTGGYLLASDTSQRFWAAVELHRTTGRDVYAQRARAHLEGKSIAIGPLSWSDAQTYGLIGYLFDEGGDPEIRREIAAQLTTWADGMATLVGSPSNPQRAAVTVYAWASNKAALDNAALLAIANLVAPDGRYVDAALDQLHYVLGRNPMSKSYVTGYGADPVKNPHNRTMFSIGRIVPGVLVGGPNEQAQDGIAPRSDGPRSYVDDTRAYSVNENAIDYNASLVFAAALFRAR